MTVYDFLTRELERLQLSLASSEEPAWLLPAPEGPLDALFARRPGARRPSSGGAR